MDGERLQRSLEEFQNQQKMWLIVHYGISEVCSLDGIAIVLFTVSNFQADLTL